MGCLITTVLVSVDLFKFLTETVKSFHLYNPVDVHKSNSVAYWPLQPTASQHNQVQYVPSNAEYWHCRHGDVVDGGQSVVETCPSTVDARELLRPVSGSGFVTVILFELATVVDQWCRLNCSNCRRNVIIARREIVDIRSRETRHGCSAGTHSIVDVD